MRVDGLGRVTKVGMLLRVAADGTISRMVVSGRVLFGERVRDALMRHLEKDLGPLALPRLPADPTPFTIVEYFPDPDRSGFHDPRHHAVSLAYVVPVDGDCQPTQEALDLAWFTPAEAVSDVGARQMTGGHDRLLRLALAHVGELPVSRSAERSRVGSRPELGTSPIVGDATYCWGPMPEGATIHRTAAALRTALVDQKMVRFDAPRLIGITPRAGRIVERVESHGKHLEIAVGRRRRPAHPHAAERVVAPLPRRRAAGSARTTRCAP